MGYFYNKEDSNEIIKGYENNYDRGINILEHIVYIYMNIIGAKLIKIIKRDI